MSGSRWLLLCCLACSGAEEETGVEVVSGDLVLADEHNYRYEGTLDVPSHEVAEYSDLSIDFSGLTSDLQCHDLDPVADVDNVSMIGFQHLSEAEVEQGLSTDSLQQSDLTAYVAVQPGDETSVLLSEFTFFGTDPDIESYFYQGSASWLVLFTSGTTVGVGARALIFLTPTSGSTNTDVVLDPACGMLDFSADLRSLTRLPVPAEGPWTLDWSGLTQDGHGVPMETGNVSSVMVGYFADESAADLEARFLDLELLADRMWTQEVEGGTYATLDSLVDADGAAFEGFDAEGTWILALRCGLCANPAPLFLSVLDVR